MPATATKPRSINKNDLERRAVLKREIDAMRREASDKAKQLAQLDAEIEAWALDKGKGDPVKRSGFVISFLTKQASVGWKGLFAAKLGQEEVKRAEQEAGTKTVMAIERAG